MAYLIPKPTIIGLEIEYNTQLYKAILILRKKLFVP